MLKWTSMQKLPEPSTPRIFNTPNNNLNRKCTINRKRRATINNITSNKENLITSTPVNKRCDNSPLLLEEFLALTPPPKIQSQKSKTCNLKVLPEYSSTLPKFAEDYSPNIICSGQMLAIRGLLPDSYIGNPRYIQKNPNQGSNLKFEEKPLRKILTRKRKLENDFNKSENEKDKTTLSSTKMGDLTLDKLIDAILDSTKKDKNIKRKTPRRSFNLRRKTLLKNSANVDLILSPSYKPADDPCSDLSFSELKNTEELEEINDKKDNKVIGKRKLSFNEKNFSNSKKSRRSSNSRKYFEVGVALPSIYV